MMLKTTVFLSSVNNLSDARYGAGMGVSLIGFPLATSHPHRLSEQDFREITDWLAGVALVGEFDDEPAHEVRRLAERYPLQYVLTNKSEAIEDLVGLELPIILRVTETNPQKLQQLMAWHADTVHYFLLELPHGTTSHGDLPLSPPQLQQLCADHPILLGYPVTPEALDPLLNDIRPMGIALRGGEEIRPGYKDFDQIADVLEALEAE
ncbi:phosphoribosylanthranilate isomerase [Catalinimonas alkaloidigena]|uniref:phosphoribosylanthranilate isomerase n=1 Tax=Catalinimonas alkaloidigena TaxID=1075417 RepID=A0A1G9K444_9BACT|nr:hypothetical protein [Catalinimonas alkaloidigena]SDL44469.1 phosphoribosylanthranilate isomerase [Catalinimonas alkaloidigena]